MKQKRVVLLVNAMSAGGAERVVSILLRELVARCYSVTLICLERIYFYEIPEEVNVVELSQSDGKLNGILKLLQLVYLAYRLKRYSDQHSLEVIQSHLFRANYVNLLSKVFGAKHSVQVVNAGVLSGYLNGGLQGRVNLKLAKFLYPYADCIINKALAMSRDMREFIPFPNAHEKIIYNPLDIDNIQSMATQAAEDFQFRPDRKYLCNVGRFETFKRQDVIIRAIPLLSEEFELILIGDGVNRDHCVKLADSLGISERVHFLGKRDNPYMYMAKSDIFILSSDDGEGFPNVLVEAMICNTPVISTDCLSGPREILAPESSIEKRIRDEIEVAECGVLVPVNNPELMVEAIGTVISDNSLRRGFQACAQQRAMSFSKNIIVDQYQKLLLLE